MENPTQTAVADTTTSTGTNSKENLVPESDVLAVKAGSAKQMAEQQKQHSSDMESLQQKLSEAHNRLAQAEAKAKTLEEKVSLSTAAQEELSRVKVTEAAATKQATEMSAKLLDAKRRLIANVFQVPEATIADKCKTVEQLDNFEEALKIVTAAKGSPGNYAIGGSGASNTPSTPQERARQILSKATIAGKPPASA